MVYVVKETFDVSLDKPLAPCEAVLYLAQSCMTAFAGAESVGSILKAVVIDCFQYHSCGFLYQLVVD